MIHFLHTSFDTPLPAERWQHYCDLLPQRIVEKINRYVRWQDRHASLYGSLLVREIVLKLDFDPTLLEQLERNAYGKPFWPHVDLHFNLSHSANRVICAASQHFELGVDIEHIRTISWEDFQNYMSAEQWAHIKQSANPTHHFFQYWSMKESVIKAIGQGLSFPLTDIHFEGNTTTINHQTWHLQSIPLDPNYACYIATEKTLDRVEPVEIAYI